MACQVGVKSAVLPVIMYHQPLQLTAINTPGKHQTHSKGSFRCCRPATCSAPWLKVFCKKQGFQGKADSEQDEVSVTSRITGL